MDKLSRIKELKAALNAVILAHNYQPPEVQDIGDFVGDSLALAMQAKKLSAPVIVCCGVRFMAETAKILSPSAQVLLPASGAGCPMADMSDPAEVAAYKKAHPDTLLVAYVNTTAAVKALVDICCTSANADRVLRSLPADREIMFLPDRNLGRNVARQLGREVQVWPGCCPVHDAVTAEALLAMKRRHPKALALVHPECRPDVVAVADEALSTGGMVKFIRESPCREFIVGTEGGILHRLAIENPDKRLYPLEPMLVCPDMKKTSLEDVLRALETRQEVIELPADILEKARRPIERMLALG